MTLDRPIREDELSAQRRFLWRLARGLVGDALAEDVVQEAEVRALALAGRPANVRAWLVTVTRRIALNLRRAGTRRERHEDAAGGATVRRAPAEPPEVLAGLELQAEVLDAVRALEEPYRAVVWLRYYEDQKPQEIAERLALPLATVKTRLRRALERLRERMDDRRGGREAWAVALAPLARRAATVAGATAGGLVVKKLVVAAAFAALGVIGWRSWRGGEPARSAEPAEARSTVELFAAPEPPRAAPRPEEPGAPGARSAVAELAAPASEPLSASTATLLVHVTHADGTDAGGIGLVLWPEEDPLAELNARSADTDASGRARLEGVPPAAFTLHTDRGTRVDVTLSAGEERALEIALPSGVAVTGIVVEGGGAPVAGAEVWLEGLGPGSRTGRVVARSGSDGRFALRAVGLGQSIAAFADGFAPSLLERLSSKDAGSGEIAVTLVLDRPGTELRGRVVDWAGRPVAGALVALGTRWNRAGPGASGIARMWPRARVLVTDEDGRFRAGFLALDDFGPVPLHAWAPDLALVRADVESVPGPGETCVIRLEPGAEIDGRVIDPDGRAVRGALVGLLRAGAIEPSECPFELPRARTDDDGRFRMTHVPAGEVRVRVELDGQPRVGCEETRTLVDETTEPWELVLGASRAITGRVVDVQGRGLGGQVVSVSDGRFNSLVHTDASGAFSFLPPPDSDAWTLELLGAGLAPERRADVRPGAEIELVARAAVVGTVAGGFSDTAGRAVPGEKLFAWLEPEDEDAMFVQGRVASDGHFAFADVAPGRYRVRIASGELTLAASPLFDLAEGAVVELDWLESAPAPR